MADPLTAEEVAEILSPQMIAILARLPEHGRSLSPDQVRTVLRSHEQLRADLTHDRDAAMARAERLTKIAADLHWMARRYADGRMSYAPGLFNDHTRALLAMGVDLNPTGDGTVWARDAMGRKFDGLSDEEAALTGAQKDPGHE